MGASSDPTPLKPGNAGGGKRPQFKTDAIRGEGTPDGCAIFVGRAAAAAAFLIFFWRVCSAIRNSARKTSTNPGNRCRDERHELKVHLRLGGGSRGIRDQMFSSDYI